MFVDVSHQIRDNPGKLHCGAVCADLDRDGQPEIFVCGYGGSNVVLKWDGSAMSDATPTELADIGRRAIGAAAGDFDGDGGEELYVLNTDVFTGRKRFDDRLYALRDGLWRNILPSGGLPFNQHSGRSVAAIDRKGCGRYGFLLACHGGPLKLVEPGAEGLPVECAKEAGLDACGAGRGLLVAPILGSAPDIFFTCDDGPNFFFQNRGDGTFVERAADLGIQSIGHNGRGATAIDYDEDGVLDVVAGSWLSRNHLWRLGSEGIFEDVAVQSIAEPGKVRSVIAADFDNDGHPEIFFNCLGEGNRLFAFRRGAWQQIDCGEALDPSGFGTGAVVGDFDGDGALELLISRGETDAQPLVLYRPARVGKNWIRVQPQTPAGAPARNALVILEQSGRRQMRVIDGGSGYLCQMEPWAHFGLGDNAYPSSIEVRWPDGSIRRVGPVSPGSALRIPHP